MSIFDTLMFLIAAGAGLFVFLFVCAPLLEEGPMGWVVCLFGAALLIGFAAT